MFTSYGISDVALPPSLQRKSTDFWTFEDFHIPSRTVGLYRTNSLAIRNGISCAAHHSNTQEPDHHSEGQANEFVERRGWREMGSR